MSGIHEKIKEMRKKKNLTLLEVAEYLGVKEATAQRYESGSIKNIKHETVCKLAELFDCDPQYLMGWGGEDPGTYNSMSITDEEKMLLELFRRVPAERQQLVLDMIRIALKQSR